MENQQSQNTSSKPVTTSLSRFNSRNAVVIIFLVFFIALIAFYGISSVRKGNNPSQNTTNNTTSQKDIFVAPYTVLYGSWKDNASTIYAYDLSKSKEYILATLPASVKKVSVLSPTTLIFINKTDLRDHGKEIAKYDLNSKQISTIFKAAQGFGIDDYVLSPDKSKIATWEVQVNPDSGTLLGGKSRVYTAALNNPTQKNLIYDEQSSESVPVHYPRAILDSGRVFSDSFMPNSTAGWAYGMSVADFNGANKQEIDGMKNGQYGTQPNLSPDGKFLAYGAYDGSKGDGTKVINGFRQALLTPNVVELLDTSTLGRTKLVGMQSSNNYPVVTWGNDPDTLLLSVNALVNTQSGVYKYDLKNNVVQKIESMPEETVIALLPNGLELQGKPDLSDSALGNLGSNYSAPYTKMALVEPSSGKTTPINLSSNYAQYISVVSSETFGDLTKISGGSRHNLQLQAFYFKTQLAPTREAQQSQPENCKPVPGNTNPCGLPRCQDLVNAQLQNHTNQFPNNGVLMGQIQIRAKCWDSPLYLYGPEKLNVSVKIWTPIYDSSPKDSKGTYEVILGKDGEIIVNGKNYQSISYAYIPAIKKVNKPTKGSVVNKNDIEKTLRNYASKLGLNTKETTDLVNYGKSVVKKPYVFVSFYDQATSQGILPITFNPTPDVYRNIVFYFKNLDTKPSNSISEPVFSPVKRRGFTAIEISGIVE